MNSEVYAKAPVIQAVLDIRVRGSADKGLDELQGAFDEAYPELYQKPHQVQLKVQGELGKHEASAEATDRLVAVIYRSADQKQLYQVRPDGFALNRLAPYQEWDAFVGEAKRLWSIYKRAIKPEIIELVGLTYLNKIAVPVSTDFRDYFRSYVEIPRELPQELRNFSMAYQIDIPSVDGTLQISQTYLPPDTPDFANVALNIQAFKSVSLPATEEGEQQLWSLFDDLRIAKSAAFEACITERVRLAIR